MATEAGSERNPYAPEVLEIECRLRMEGDRAQGQVNHPSVAALLEMYAT